MIVPEFQYPTYTYKAEVVNIVDGDTIDVNLDVGFHTHIFKRLRFLGIDTYETRGDEREKGLIAKERLRQLFAAAHAVYVQTEMDGTGKYGRVLAWVWVETVAGPNCVNAVLLDEGHGTPL